MKEGQQRCDAALAGNLALDRLVVGCEPRERLRRRRLRLARLEHPDEQPDRTGGGEAALDFAVHAGPHQLPNGMGLRACVRLVVVIVGAGACEVGDARRAVRLCVRRAHSQ